MTPIVLVPGLLCIAEVFASQITALWPYGPVTVAATLAGESIPELAAAALLTEAKAGRALPIRSAHFAECSSQMAKPRARC